MVGFSGEQVVLVDANVWVSRNLRDWICALYIHSNSMFTVVWTEDILAETLHAVRRLYPDMEGGRIARVRESIVRIFKDGQIRDFTVDTDKPMPDLYDRHVHAAAIARGVDILVANNIKDLRPARQEDQDALPYEVYTADEFFMLIADCQPMVVRDAIQDQISYFLKRRTDPNLPAGLRRAGAPDFAERVRKVQLDMDFTVIGALANAEETNALDMRPDLLAVDRDDVMGKVTAAETETLKDAQRAHGQAGYGETPGQRLSD